LISRVLGLISIVDQNDVSESIFKVQNNSEVKMEELNRRKFPSFAAGASVTAWLPARKRYGYLAKIAKGG